MIIMHARSTKLLYYIILIGEPGRAGAFHRDMGTTLLSKRLVCMGAGRQEYI